MATSAQLLINIAATNRQALSAIQGVENAVRQMGTRATSTFSTVDRSSRSLASSLSNTSKQIASFFILRGAVRLGEKMFELGSAAEETESMFIASMGNMEDSAREFTKTLADGLGVYEVDAKNNIATLYNITHSMGLTEDSAYSLAKGMTMLAYDMGSLFNLPYTETFRAIKSGLVGETEPLRRLGVLTTEAGMAEIARQNGITKSITKMNEQEKIMVRGIAIMQQSRVAQGDMARTLGSSANMLRVLTATWQEALAVWGQVLLPLIGELFKAFMLLGRALIYIGNVVKNFLGITTQQAESMEATREAIKNASGGMGYMASETDGLTDSEKALAKGIKQTGKAVKAGLASFDEMITLREQASDASSTAGAGTGGIDPSIMGAFSKLSNYDPASGVIGKIDEILEPMKEKFRTFVEDIMAIFATFDTTRFTEALDRIMQTSFVKDFETTVSLVIKAFAKTMTDEIPIATEILAGSLETLQALLEGDFKTAWEKFNTTLSSTEDFTSTLVTNFSDLHTKLTDSGALGTALALILDTVVVVSLIGVGKKLVDTVLLFTRFTNKIRSTITWLSLLYTSLSTSALSAFSTFGRFMWTTMVNLRRGLIPEIYLARRGFINFFKSIYDMTPVAFNRLFAYISNAITMLKANFINALNNAMAKFFAFCSTLLQLGKTAFNSTITSAKTLANGIKTAFSVIASTATLKVLAVIALLTLLAAVFVKLWESSDQFRAIMAINFESLILYGKVWWNAMKTIFYMFMSFVKFDIPIALTKFVGFVISSFTKVYNFLNKWWTVIKTIFGLLAFVVGETLPILFENFGVDFKKAMASVGEFFTSVFNGIMSFFTDFAKKIMNEIVWVTDQLSKLGAEILGFTIPHIDLDWLDDLLISDSTIKQLSKTAQALDHVKSSATKKQELINLNSVDQSGLFGHVRLMEAEGQNAVIDINNFFIDRVNSLESQKAEYIKANYKLSDLVIDTATDWNKGVQDVIDTMKNGADDFKNIYKNIKDSIDGLMSSDFVSNTLKGIKDGVDSALGNLGVATTETVEDIITIGDDSLAKLGTIIATIIAQEKETNKNNPIQPIEVIFKMDSKEMARQLIAPLAEEQTKQGYDFISLGGV
jgi:hypothetical protein